MIERQTTATEYFEFDQLAAIPSVAHAVFTRRRGFSQAPYQGLNVSVTTGDDPERVRRNRAAIVEALDLPLVWAAPVHGNDVVIIDADFVAEQGHDQPWQQRLSAIRADAMITDQPGFMMLWGFGDCSPILLADPAHDVVALAHAGWRGAAGAVAVQTIAAMHDRFGTDPRDLVAAVGPSIGACCYQVSEEIRERFAANPIAWEAAVFEERRDDDGKMSLYLDVPESSRRQLLNAGVPAAQIETSGYCTGCRTDLFYSNRREPKPSGRFAAGIGLRGPREQRNGLEKVR